MTMVRRLGTAVEARIRRAWRSGPGPSLRVAARLYGAVSDARSLAYDVGFLRSRSVPIPVISVGGLTTGGSGKTPIAAAIGRWLSAADISVAVITAGLPDEDALHRSLNPAALVLGTRDRYFGIVDGAQRGARVVILDSGFQHRRLQRDLDILALNAEDFGEDPALRLPAGPYRESLSAAGRADILVLVQRGCAPFSDDLTAWLNRTFPRALLVRCRIRAGSWKASNEAAADAPSPAPGLAVAATMYPESFFGEIRPRLADPVACVAFRDHHVFSRRDAIDLVRRGGGRGILTTGKNAPLLAAAVQERTPVWSVEEEIAWEAGEGELARMVRAAAMCGRSELCSASPCVS